jgi:hypothetical protein
MSIGDLRFDEQDEMGELFATIMRSPGHSDLSS